eukprot:gene7991-223_t
MGETVKVGKDEWTRRIRFDTRSKCEGWVHDPDGYSAFHRFGNPKTSLPIWRCAYAEWGEIPAPTDDAPNPKAPKTWQCPHKVCMQEADGFVWGCELLNE